MLVGGDTLWLADGDTLMNDVHQVRLGMKLSR